jgi:hypothetical protein
MRAILPAGEALRVSATDRELAHALAVILVADLRRLSPGQDTGDANARPINRERTNPRQNEPFRLEVP